MFLYYDHYIADISFDSSIGIGGNKWPAADLFCSFITAPALHRQLQPLFKNKKCIELGSGCGLAGIIIEKAFDPLQVVMTDIGSYITLIKSNIEANNLSKSYATVYDWNSEPDQLSSLKFDVVLALEW